MPFISFLPRNGLARGFVSEAESFSYFLGMLDCCENLESIFVQVDPMELVDGRMLRFAIVCKSFEKLISGFVLYPALVFVLMDRRRIRSMSIFTGFYFLVIKMLCCFFFCQDFI